MLARGQGGIALIGGENEGGGEGTYSIVVPVKTECVNVRYRAYKITYFVGLIL